MAAFILPKALPTSRPPSAFRSVEQHPAGWEKTRMLFNQAQVKSGAWECVGLASSVLDVASWMFQARRSWKGQNADLPVCKETTPRPSPGPRSQLLGSSSSESSLCLSCCVFPPDELVQP